MRATLKTGDTVKYSKGSFYTITKVDESEKDILYTSTLSNASSLGASVFCFRESALGKDVFRVEN